MQQPWQSLPELNEPSRRHHCHARLAPWVNAWPRHFINIFDGVFGTKILSIRFFLKSCTASLFCLFFISFILLSLIDQTYLSWWNLMPDYNRPYIICLIIFGNFIPDFVSLVETRILLRYLEKSPAVTRIISILVFDFIATASIFAIIYPIFIFLATGNQDRFSYEELVRSYDVYLPLFLMFLTEPNLSFGSTRFFDMPLQYYTTFFTSVWLWTFGLSVFLVKIMENVLDTFWTKFRDKFLNIDEKPISSIGWLFSGLVFVLFMIASPVML